VKPDPVRSARAREHKGSSQPFHPNSLLARSLRNPAMKRKLEAWRDQVNADCAAKERQCRY
jgi:hypothetical protein